MWQPYNQPDDPIAHIMHDLHCIGAQLNDNFQILSFNEAPVDILATPYQYLGSTMLEAAARARTQAAEGTKDKNSGIDEIDAVATKASHKNLSEKDMTYLQTFQVGGGWSTEKLKSTGIDDQCACKLCGQIHSGNNLV